MYRILYVDDEPGLLDIGRLFLERGGEFEVDCITSAPGALALLNAKDYDAIISDYQMPGMDGIEFLKKVRSSGNAIPFIIFTGRGREEIVIQALNEGADFYLQKGGDPKAQFAELTHKVRIAIGHHEDAKKIQSLNRLYSVLSATSKAVLTIRTKEEFLSEICRILVTTGGFRMAWIGLADTEHRTIRPVASAGHDDGYLESVDISTDDIPRGRGPTGTAYREGKYYVANDVNGDPRLEPWRENALERGYLANAAFPFAPGTKNAGVVSLYAPVTGFFDAEIIDLLEKLAIDITFSLRIIDDRDDQKQAEEALRKNEMRLKRAEEIGRSGSWEFLLNENEVRISEGAQILYGLKGTQWTIEEVQKVPLPEYRPLLDAAMRDLIAGKSPYNVEFKIQRPSDGILVEIHSLAEYDPGRNVVFGVIHDINEKKKMELTLQASAEKFREIFNAANDAIHLHEVDERGLPGKFIDVNEQACRMLQYSKAELLQMGPLDLATSYHSRPLEQIGEEIKTRGSAIFETELRRKDGVIVPVEVNVHVVFIQGGRMALSVIRDLTRRNQDEAAFRRLNADYKAIIDNAPSMIWYKDTKNNFIRVNPAVARMVGKSVEEIDGKNAYDLFPDLAEKYYQDDLEVIRSGTSRLGIIEPLTTAGGEKRWIQADKIPLTDEEGSVDGILLFAVDITERKRAEDALHMANKKLNLLSEITRHDINNQLMALKSYIELSKDAIDNPVELEEYFAKEIIITDVLAEQIRFTKDYENLGVKSPVWQGVNELVRNAGSALPLGNTRIETGCPGLGIFADPLLEKVFFNLIDNSLNYGGDAMTTIRITMDNQGENLRIIYEDDGQGITAEEKKKLFTKGFGRHTGLGMFLSREILSITGITILENGEPGRGARFEITVPKGGSRFAGASS